jgi:hypothetical protein
MTKIVAQAEIFRILGQLALKLAIKKGLAQNNEVPQRSISFIFKYPFP